VIARAIGELTPKVAGLKIRRSRQPVRRDSRYAGEREDRVWRPIAGSRAEARKLIALRLQAAEHFERTNKQRGRRNGPLGHIGLEVLRELYRIVDYRTGRLEPAIATICQKVCRSRAAVVAALKRLKAHGFLDWVRRSEPTHNEGAGPQVRQISNAYGFGLPARAAAWVKRKLSSAPPPDCELARRKQAREDMDTMLDTVSPEEQARVLAGDGALGDALARLGAALGRSASSLGEQKPNTGI
jgi:hypothetical protein